VHHRVIIVGAALVALGLGACSKGTTATNTTSTTSPSTTTAQTIAPAATSTTVAGATLAGQPTATSRSDLGFQAGYQETTVEAGGLQLLATYEPADDTPGTQVHCPAAAVTVGATFVCQVDANATSSIDEPLKVDTTDPLKLEFAVIQPSNFICSAHATWVVQAMAAAGMPCTSSPTTTQGQGGQGGQGQGGQGQGQ
jgi:hypothetical protein